MVTRTSSEHTLQQLKLVVPGGLITYYLQTIHELLAVVQQGGDGWGRIVALTASGSGVLTISLFLYVLSIPWIKGVEPNYRSWRESGVLSKVIPVLTGSIVVGWFLVMLTLGQWSRLGYIKGVIGASALYALVFGLLGLIPAPKLHRQ